MTEKDKKIIEDSKKNNIPIFVLKASDKLALQTINFYVTLAARMKCKPAHIKGAEDRWQEFFEYREFYGHKMKFPD